ncbi:Beta-lactamase-like protein 2-like protein [Frankliniella fusca]|uniref:Beta-lactamase-like protein 2 homolog n=1 Tax=Frankliniella fusca TaxID=407009 RepID=A0AAE1HKQ0_9NEOP|nr:Beta-lactamase-like protein 2-like protein [Frankliniella fusca]
MAKAIVPPISKLCNGVIRILGMNPGVMTLQGTNTYLLGNGKRRILIDAGEDGKLEYITNLKTVLQEENVSIEHIIITHWHQDHIGGVKDILQHVGSDVSVWKFPRSCGKEQSGIPLKYLKDGDEFRVDDTILRVFHTPGHTTDHVILFSPVSGHMFSGDNVLGEGTAVFEDLYEYMKSLNIMLKLNPMKIFPGHGPVVEDPVSKLSYYINHRNAREAQILSVLHDNQEKKLSTMDIVKIIYADVNENLHNAAAYNVSHHLEKLQKEGKVVSEDGDWMYQRLGSSL